MTTEAKVVVSATGVQAMGRDFGQAAKQVDRLGRVGKKTGAALRTTLGRLKGLTAIVGGLSVAVAGKRVLDFGRQLAHLKADAELGEAGIQKLKAQILATADESKIMPTNIAAAMRVFQDFGGQLEFGREMMKDLAMFSKATNTPIEEAATLAATLHKTLGLTKDETVDALSTMNELGKAGQMALADVAKNLPEILAGGKRGKMTGFRAVQQLGGAHQIIAKSFGTGPEAAARSRTALNALLKDLVARSKKLRSMGIRVFNKDGSMKDLDVIMAAVLKKTKGDARKLQKIFAQESIGAAMAFADTKDTSKLAADVPRLLKNTRGGRGNLERAFKDVTTGIGKAAHDIDSASVRIETALQEHGAALADWITKNPLKALGIGAGGYAAAKGIPALIGALLRRRGKGGGGLGGLGGVGVQHVWVDNIGGGLGGGKGGGAGGKAAAAGGVVAAAAVGYAIGTGIDDAIKELTGTHLSTRVSGAFTEKGGALEGDYSRTLRGAASVSMMKGGALAALDDAKARAALLAGMSKRGLTAGGQKIDQALLVREMTRILAAEGSIDVKAMIPLLKKIAEKELRVEVSSKGGLDRVEVQAARGGRR